MSSNEPPKPKSFDKIHAIIICQDNGESINFAFHFNVNQQTVFLILNSLHEHLTRILPELKKELEKNQTPH